MTTKHPRRGGIVCYSSTPHLTNCTINGNSVLNLASSGELNSGGGIYCNYSSPIITNCILWDNLPEEIFEVESFITISSSDVQNGGYPKDGTVDANGNMDYDPLFVAPGSSDYHLQPGSLCIERGIAIAGLDQDIEGTARPQDGDNNGTALYDMGAYEYVPANQCKGDFSGDGDVDVFDLGTFAKDFGRTDCLVPNALPCEGDFDHDGDVDVFDLGAFAKEFGRTDCIE